MNIIKCCLIIFSLRVISILKAVGMESIPHVNEEAANSYKYDYHYANTHRAFAIGPEAPGRGWLIKQLKMRQSAKL